MITIKVIAGSVRPGRFNIQPAVWITKIAKKRKSLNVELLDLAEIKLPFLDEPIPPMMNQYSKKHTKKWSKTISEADGFVFVTPEYNHGVSPALKNAIDYLFYEWNSKPVSFISYGSMAGGTRSVEHLRGIVAELKMYDLREQIMLPNYFGNLDKSGKYLFTDKHVIEADEMLNNLTFWAKKMKEARQELKKLEK